MTSVQQKRPRIDKDVDMHLDKQHPHFIQDVVVDLGEPDSNPLSECLLCGLGSVTVSHPRPPHRIIVVKLKWRRGECCCKPLWVPTVGGE